MSIGLLYWILWLLWALFGGWAYWPASGATPGTMRPIGAHVLLLILTFLLGWAVFGFVIQGPGTYIHN